MAAHLDVGAGRIGKKPTRFAYIQKKLWSEVRGSVRDIGGKGWVFLSSLCTQGNGACVICSSQHA